MEMELGSNSESESEPRVGPLIGLQSTLLLECDQHQSLAGQTGLAGAGAGAATNHRHFQMATNTSTHTHGYTGTTRTAHSHWGLTDLPLRFLCPDWNWELGAGNWVLGTWNLERRTRNSRQVECLSWATAGKKRQRLERSQCRRVTKVAVFRWSPNVRCSGGESSPRSSACSLRQSENWKT